jgi:crotonobetaine/carnitine-CoA ligase
LTQQGEFVVSQLDRWVDERPQACCFYDGDEDRSYSYAEFGSLSDSVAGFLSSCGVAQGVFVGVLTRSPVTATLAMLGAWKAGGVYAPINFDFFDRLLAYQLNDAKPRVLIVDVKGMELVGQVWSRLEFKPVVILARHPDEPPAVSLAGAEVHDWALVCSEHERPAVTLKPHDIACLIYTSGTTGPAKGVLLPHRWIVAYTFFGRLPLTHDDVVYNDLPLYHVGGAIANVARAIWVGCEVACWQRFSATQFWSRIRKVRATVAILLDSMIPWLMNAASTADDRGNTLSRVHMQPLPRNHHEVAHRFGFDIVTCGFGQTESGSSMLAVIDELSQRDIAANVTHKADATNAMLRLYAEYGVVPLSPEQVDVKGFMGFPNPFFEVQVMNAEEDYCGADEVGQLVVRPRVTNILFKEYLGKPTETAFALRNAWFHTGDAVTRRPDGAYVFVDRMGDRIRVRGENVSSFQIEDLLNQHPAIAASAAFSVPAREGGEDDVAVCLVLREGVIESAANIRSWCDQNMPKFMRPRYIFIRSDLPRTATNKIEKYKLRMLTIEALRSAPGGVA